MKSNSTATAAGVLLLGLGIVLGLAYYFGAFGLLWGASGGANENTTKQDERRTNANANPPGQDAAGPAAQLAADGKNLGDKVKKLDEAVKALWGEREKALNTGATSKETQAFLSHLKDDVPKLSQEVKEESDKLNASLAGLQDTVEKGGQQAALSPEQQALVNAISKEHRERALPMLVLLSLLLLVAAAQFFLLRRQQHRMVDAKDELLVNVKTHVTAIKGSIDEEVKGTNQSLGELVSGQQTLSADVAKALSAAQTARDHVKEVLSRLPVGGGKGSGHASGGVDEELESFYEQQNKSARAGGKIVYENEATAERAEPHRFPAPVGEYMRLVKDSAYPVRADYINKVLVEDQSSSGALVLVKNPPAVSDGTSYVVPSMDYFLSEQDYVKNYSNYFDCSEQQAGYVWIDKPAVVTRVADGWRLVDKGVLEVRQ